MGSAETSGHGQALGIVWCGTRTAAYEATVGFFEQVLGLPAGARRPHFCRLDLPDASAVEVFDAASGEYPHFATGPVPGFQVPDLDAASAELARAGAELLLPPGQGPPEYRWQHFRAPDGYVYELVEYRSRPAPGDPAGPLGITRLAWVGTRTAAYEATRRFFRDALGLEPVEEAADLAEYRLADGSAVEVIRPGSALDHAHFTTGPVTGFAVQDVATATGHLRAAGTEILLERRTGRGGWSHFRAPDGNVYEVKQIP